MDLIEKYKRYRQSQVQLHTKVLRSHVDEAEFKESAKILGILNKDQVVIDSAAEKDALYDFNIYASIRSGKSSLSKFIDAYLPEDNVEEELLNAMVHSDASLYEIVEIHKEDGLLYINDILSGGSTPVKLVDLSLSESLSRNVLIFTRLIKLEEFSLTSGLGFMFSANHKDYIMTRIRKMLKKMQTGNSMTDRFIVFFNLNRSDGVPVLFEKVQ